MSNSSSKSKKVDKSGLNYCSKMTINNDRCQNVKAKDSEFCKLHSKKKTEFCNQTTKRGEKCKGPKGKCIYHTKGYVTQSKISSDKARALCKGVNKIGDPCRSLCKIGSDFCTIHSLSSKQICGHSTQSGKPCNNPRDKCRVHNQSDELDVLDKESSDDSDERSDSEESAIEQKSRIKTKSSISNKSTKSKKK